MKKQFFVEQVLGAVINALGDTWAAEGKERSAVLADCREKIMAAKDGESLKILNTCFVFVDSDKEMETVFDRIDEAKEKSNVFIVSVPYDTVYMEPEGRVYSLIQPKMVQGLLEKLVFECNKRTKLIAPCVGDIVKFYREDLLK